MINLLFDVILVVFLSFTAFRFYHRQHVDFHVNVYVKVEVKISKVIFHLNHLVVKVLPICAGN